MVCIYIANEKDGFWIGGNNYKEETKLMGWLIGNLADATHNFHEIFRKKNFNSDDAIRELGIFTFFFNELARYQGSSLFTDRQVSCLIEQMKELVEKINNLYGDSIDEIHYRTATTDSSHIK